MALPLQTRGEIIGALDVQSKEPAAFGEDDVFILQALADQVAVAISNAHLFRQVEQSLEEERRTYGELSSRAWRELLRSQPNLGFLSDAQGVIPAGDLWEPQMVQAVRTGEVTWGKQDSATVAIPIRLRDQVIGMIDAQKPDGAGSWDLEEIEMLRALVDRLETALEGARLYQDAQRHAARDRLLAEVSSRMRETLEMETLLRTAASEMRRALDLDELVVRLVPPGSDGGAEEDSDEG
jgi:GAF domain-containing protein